MVGFWPHPVSCTRMYISFVFTSLTACCALVFLNLLISYMCLGLNTMISISNLASVTTEPSTSNLSFARDKTGKCQPVQ